MPYAIGSYVHGDSISSRKGGCMVRVNSETDFGANTEEFKIFVDYVARICYAIIHTIPEKELEKISCGCFNWAEIEQTPLDAESLVEMIVEKRDEIESQLKEKVQIVDVSCMA